MKPLFRLYRLLLSPALHLLVGPGMGCRFTPSCSEYAEEAVRQHGPLRGGALAVQRILKCQPFSKGGYDPIAPQK